MCDSFIRCNSIADVAGAAGVYSGGKKMKQASLMQQVQQACPGVLGAAGVPCCLASSSAGA